MRILSDWLRDLLLAAACGLLLAIATYAVVVMVTTPAPKPLPTRIEIRAKATPVKVEVEVQRKERPVQNETIARIIEAVCKVENRSGDPSAIGDGGDAVGVAQIHTEMVDECNRIMGEQVWTPADRFSPAKSREMMWCFFNDRQKHYKLGDTLDEQIRLGSLWNKPDGTAPAGYRGKVQFELVML